MQLARRGGLKGGQRFSTDEAVNKLVKDLRKQKADEDAAKRKKAGGQPQADPSLPEESLQSEPPPPRAEQPTGKSGGVSQAFQPPGELLQFGQTDLEKQLSEVLQGPDARWHEDHHPPAKATCPLSGICLKTFKGGNGP